MIASKIIITCRDENRNNIASKKKNTILTCIFYVYFTLLQVEFSVSLGICIHLSGVL